MENYNERLRVAKKGYVATDGPAEAGARLLVVHRAGRTCMD